MENKITELKPIYKYSFSTNTVKNILSDIILELKSNIADLSTSINLDYANFGIKFSLKDIINIFSDACNEPVAEIGKINDNQIEDGFGNIGLVYNGNFEITIKTIITSIITHNNLVLIPENNYEINNTILDIVSRVLNQNNYYNGIILLDNEYKNAYKYESWLDKILFVGDKFEYIKLRKKLEIPIEYNGYGYISLISETNNILVENIRVYCLNNYINLDYYNKNIEEAIDKINYFNINQTVAIFSNNQEHIIQAILKLKANNIYINKSPLVNYKFKLNRNSFIEKKFIK